ncbi:hypothetical protein DUNSADRAFT_9822 [Dunaliella salina]|uniref:Uncharacterized protein n=1 Tax=Dunaliella salina TaxID=3046 RepID=A0ABQ7GGM2_DUNSA|nr:hypothetical protein DUNSADRAFT_9822 [Dunaliella salina]|eukprot:KAF5833755.1 hypothetical protein DUNSADRAFT_9822 [Dunaliella salina]
MAWNAGAAKKESWADDVDTAEQEGTIEAPPPDNAAFPSLGEAAKQAPQGGKGKKKGMKMDMRTFMQQAPGPAPAAGRFVAPGRAPMSEKEILLSLPTGSRGRVEGEEEAGPPGGMGGAFRDYGGDRGERRGRRGEDGADEFIPSRADEVRDWGSTRKFQPSDDGPRGRGFGGGFGGRGDSREGRPVSMADEAADWGGSKKFEPSTGFGGGFRDREGPRRGPMFEPSSKADEEEQWSRKGPLPVPDTRERSRGRERSGFGFSGDPTRNPDLEDRWGRRAPPADANGSTSPARSAVPTERPRLKLAPRTAPIEEKPQGPGTAAQPQPKKEKSNPFGAAKPREEVLKEKGVEADPLKEVLKLEQGEVIRDETPEEKELQKEIQQLRTELESFKVAGEEESDGAVAAQKELDSKETALLRLKVELDDKQRYARKKESEAAAAAAPTGSKAGEDAGQDRSVPHEESGPGKGAASSKDDKWGRREPSAEARQWDGGRDRDGGRSREPRSSAAPGQGPAKASGKW